MNRRLTWQQWSEMKDLYHSHVTEDVRMYPWTHRPIVRLENYKYVPTNRLIKTPQEGHIYLPVIRYMHHSHPPGHQVRQEMDGDQTPPPPQFCGTFFFYEPNSSILMDLGNVGVYASKIGASDALFDYRDEDLFPYDSQLKKTMVLLTSSMRSVNPSVRETFEKQMFHHLTLKPDDIPLIPHPKMLSEEFSPYSPTLGVDVARIHRNSDYADQNICVAAKKVGFNTLILQHEFGEINSVTEILVTDDNPYLRLIKRTQDPAQLSLIETTKKHTFSDRLNRGKVSKYGIMFPHSWFIEDGFYLGSKLTKVYPIIARDTESVPGKVVRLSTTCPTDLSEVYNGK